MDEHGKLEPRGEPEKGGHKIDAPAPYGDIPLFTRMRSGGRR